MPKVDKDTIIQEMLQAHHYNKPTPDTKEWWKEIAQGLGVKLFEANKKLETVLTSEELKILYAFLEKQYLPYDDLALTEVVNKIKRIIEA